ncbi:MAG: sodium:proton antiporter [Pedosphaera sp.]|nr:sodium:proton antiporter [Pedosphaera sp.]
MITPFAALLGLIALGPLFFAAWWAKHYPKVALILGGLTTFYYVFYRQDSHTVLHTGHEYVSFIALIGSLYVVSGGIHINVRGEATPLANTIFLFVGAILANVLGTTGASMLLIRPWLRLNKYRVTAHHVVFFIFIVSNVGGCLTPIGDPPLYLGYLKGVPFWWVAEHCWPMWMVALGLLLLMFFVVDTVNFRRAPAPVQAAHTRGGDWFQFDGSANGLLLAVILAAVLFANHPPFLREGLMLGAAAISYFLTPKRIHEINAFNWHPIEEVAILFIGIFATMMPALQILGAAASDLGHPAPAVFFWGSGILSSVLDNAPTYLCFLQAILGACTDPDTISQVRHLVENGGADLATFVHGPNAEGIRQTLATLQKFHPDQLAARTISDEALKIAFLVGNAQFNHFIMAVSTGAVFFGANTYIGNGPNFMVKSMADHQGVHTPTFLGYVARFSFPFMLPTLGVVWFLFFR